LLAALLVLIFIGRPLMRMLRERANRPRPTPEDQAAFESRAEALFGTQVTLDMIEKAPSYEARADLVRGYVNQDRDRAALVVRQLVAENGR
jgi:flagellar M-ring protein FliF